eukprot:GEMP01001404.1.p1 GENE.GEMP01001404.1~~GEMP01001404.1.p1  ORF type:complete len:622 (+),score=150.37 GEMP01001404.1:1636-3501(+)
MQLYRWAEVSLLQHIMKALEDVKAFHHFSDNALTAFIDKAAALLNDMLGYVNIRTQTLATISICADASYAFRAICSTPWVNRLRLIVRERPNGALQLKALAEKMVSALEVPLVRIKMAKSSDLDSVSQYYSHKLCNFLQEVLLVVPEAIFEVILKRAKQPPSPLDAFASSVVDKGVLRQFIQPNLEVAGWTQEIALRVQGVHAMERTYLGVLTFQPKEVLREGLRVEMRKHIVTTLHAHLTVRIGLGKSLDMCRKKLDALKASIENAQEFLGVLALPLWREVFDEIVEVYKRIEHRALTEGLPNTSPPRNPSSFLGVVTHALLDLSDPNVASYRSSGWYKNDREALGDSLLRRIHSVLGSVGCAAVADLLCTRIALRLKELFAWCQALTIAESDFPPACAPELTAAALHKMTTTLGAKKLHAFVANVIDIGRVQLLAAHLRRVSASACQSQMPRLWDVVENMNRAALCTLDHPMWGADSGSALLERLQKLTHFVGLSNDMDKVFVTLEENAMQPENLVFLALFSYLATVPSIKVASCERPLAAGVASLFRQVHPDSFAAFQKLYSLYAPVTTATPCAAPLDHHGAHTLNASETACTAVNIWPQVMRWSNVFYGWEPSVAGG